MPWQVFEDLREECSRYGQVVEVKVPRPANPALAAALFGTQNYGKVREGLWPHWQGRQGACVRKSHGVCKGDGG